MFESLEKRALIDLVDSQSHSAVEYLLECYGWEGILKRLKEIETKTSTNDALDSLDLRHESLEDTGAHASTPHSFVFARFSVHLKFLALSSDF
jgi:hypothetical protein